MELHQQQLREIILAAGTTQEQLARRLGVSFVTVNSWINGRTAPRASALAAIERLRGEILGDTPLLPEQLAQAVRTAESLRMQISTLVRNPEHVDRLALHLTYNTNSIEGSTMTLADTREVLFANRALANRTQVEQAEARNHQAALLWLLDQLNTKNFSISTELICGLHLRLMNGINHDAGSWRTHQARIAGSRVVLANAARVPALMATLVDQLNRAERGPRALAVLHARFEQVHPFSDGNGRIGRLLMLVMALRTGLPPPIIERERRQAYYRHLEAAQLSENFDPLTCFIAEAIVTGHALLTDDPT